MDNVLTAEQEELFRWAGCHVVLIAREPNRRDRILLASMTEEESKELCAAAMAILRRRPSRNPG